MSGRRLRNLIVASVTCLMVLTAFAAQAEDGVLRPTTASMDFYGYIDGANTGDVVSVRTGKGVLCGQFTITQAGRYGFLHVYGDDKMTAVNEGAELKEPLAFFLNGSPLAPIANQEVLWLGDGQKLRVDFTRR